MSNRAFVVRHNRELRIRESFGKVVGGGRATLSHVRLNGVAEPKQAKARPDMSFRRICHARSTCGFSYYLCLFAILILYFLIDRK